jgi:predicted nucleotidyltransferase
MESVVLYLEELISRLKVTFEQRLLYVGLQGSCRRGEADEHSDIDVMVVLEDFTIEDMDTYRSVLSFLGNSEKSCGFLCGRKELKNWNPFEICQLLHETKDLYGYLRTFVPDYSREDVRQYIQICAGNLYHEICHRYVHSTREDNISSLPCSYKAVFYLLQNIYYIKTGEYVLTKKELLRRLEGPDREVLDTALTLREGKAYDFDKSFRLLFTWCRGVLQTV